MPAWFRRQGDPVHHQRVARLMHTRGIEALSPNPRLRQLPPLHRGSPSLLRGVPMRRGNHVWRTDITDMRLHGGGSDLVAVLAGCSRDVLLWAGSLTMAVGCCLEAFEQAWEVARPAICNRDHRAHCTRLDFTGRLAAAGLEMSLDGRGRARDHGLVDRLWRTVTYEEVSLKDDETPREARQG